MAKKKKTEVNTEAEKPIEAKTEETVEQSVEATLVKEPEVVEVKTEEVKLKKSLDDRLLEYYREAKVGSVTLEGLMRDLGANEEKLGQAWDRLYDARLIEFSKFVKSCETYP